MSVAHVPLVSILTPTWNRANYLRRVWNSLRAQTYRNFEWILADDGSTDDTSSVIRKIAKESDFPVVLISASVRIGKARMDNEAISRAQGEFIVWNDSDDTLLPDAIETLVQAWLSIPSIKRGAYVGISALCAVKDGPAITGTTSIDDVLDTTWNDLMVVHGFSGDMVNLTRARDLKALRFPEVDFVVPEGIVWTTLGSGRIKLVPEVLQIREYRAPYGVSYSGRLEYCRGRAYAMATSERNLRAYSRPLMVRLWRTVTYIRYCIHGDIRLAAGMALWGNNSAPLTYISLYLPALALAIKDRVQGKVRKTHRDFDVARQTVRIRSECLNS